MTWPFELSPETWAQLIVGVMLTVLGAIVGYFFARLSTRRDKAIAAMQAAPQVLENIQQLAQELQGTYEAREVPRLVTELQATIVAASTVTSHRRYAPWREAMRLMNEALHWAQLARDGQGAQSPQALKELRQVAALLSQKAALL